MLTKTIQNRVSAVLSTSKRTFTAKPYHKALRQETLSANVKECQYAVRGAIPQRGEEIKKLLAAGQQAEFNFDKTLPCNIGNPQAVGQSFITFNREVLSAMMLPKLLDSSQISEDSKDRIKLLNSKITSPMGAYTANSKGHMYVRSSIADFIHRRDGPAVECDWNNIYMCNGASEGVRTAFRLLIRDQKDGIMVPIPQYPLYSALLTLDGGTMVKYYLDEEKGWGVDAEEIVQRIKNAKDLGINLRGMVVINPGNPTGNVLKRQDIEEIIKICHAEQIVIIADEVYQSNIYKEDVPFISFRKVLAEMGDPYKDNVELISLHSVSKGLQGECGLRGGYFEVHNFDRYANDMFYKLKSLELCANTVGQIAAQLMVDPPLAGRESDSCVELYQSEKNGIHSGMKERAELLTQTFNEMQNTSCSDIEGAMYAFPTVNFSEKAIKRAASEEVPCDFMYCLDMVNQTGIMTVPGSGFGQRENSFHYRITNLVTPTDDMRETLKSLIAFNDKWHAEN